MEFVWVRFTASALDTGLKGVGRHVDFGDVWASSELG